MGLFNKTRNLLIMDGSNIECLCSIMVKLNDIIGKRNSCELRVSKLDENHPTMIVMEYQTGLTKHLKVQKELNSSYPGLCIYDVAV